MIKSSSGWSGTVWSRTEAGGAQCSQVAYMRQVGRASIATGMITGELDGALIALRYRVEFTNLVADRLLIAPLIDETDFGPTWLDVSRVGEGLQEHRTWFEARHSDTVWSSEIPCTARGLIAYASRHKTGRVSAAEVDLARGSIGESTIAIEVYGNSSFALRSTLMSSTIDLKFDSQGELLMVGSWILVRRF